VVNGEREVAAPSLTFGARNAKVGDQSSSPPRTNAHGCRLAPLIEHGANRPAREDREHEIPEASFEVPLSDIGDAEGDDPSEGEGHDRRSDAKEACTPCVSGARRRLGWCGGHRSMLMTERGT